MFKFSKTQLRLVILGALVWSLSACGGTPLDNPSQKNILMNDDNQLVYFDNFGKIPVTNQDAKYQIRLHNSTSQNYTVTKVTLIDDLKNTLSEDLSLTSNCASLTPASICGVTINYKANSHGAYRLQAELVDNEGFNSEVSQIIVTGSEVSNSAAINMEAMPAIEPQLGNHYSVALPVYLGESFTRVEGVNGSIFCNHETQNGSSCTYFIEGNTAAEDNVLLSNSIVLYDEDNKSKSVFDSNLKIAKQAGHLLISTPDHQDITDGKEKTIKVKIYNSGNLPVEVKKITPSNVTNTSSCPTKLAAKVGNCDITLKLNQKTNGIARLSVEYAEDGNSQTKTVATSFSYGLTGDVDAKASFASMINFENAIVSYGYDIKKEIEFKNNGQVPLIYDSAEKGAGISLSFLREDGWCQNDTEIPVGGSCKMTASYEPSKLSVTEGVTSVLFKAKYKDKFGVDNTIMAHMPISHSQTDQLSILKITGDINISAIEGETKNGELTIANTSQHTATIRPLSDMWKGDLVFVSGGTCGALNGEYMLAKLGEANSLCTIKFSYHANSTSTSSANLVKLVKLDGIELKYLRPDITGIVSGRDYPVTINYAAVDVPIEFVGLATISPTPQRDGLGSRGIEKGKSVEFKYHLPALHSSIKEVSVTGIVDSYSWNFINNCAKNRVNLAPSTCSVIFSLNQGDSLNMGAKDMYLNLEYKTQSGVIKTRLNQRMVPENTQSEYLFGYTPLRITSWTNTLSGKVGPNTNFTQTITIDGWDTRNGNERPDAILEHYDAKGTIKKEVFKSQEKSNLFSNMKPETFTFNSTTANHSEASLEETISARILAIGGNLTQETKLQVGHHVPNKTVTLVSTNNSVYGSTYKINSVNYFYNGGTSNAGSTGNVKGGRASVYGIPGRATNIRVSMKVISYGGAHDKEYVFTDDKLYMCIIDDNVSYSDTGC